LSYFKLITVLLVFPFVGQASAESLEKVVLPDTLTLEHALSLSTNDHPDNLIAQTRLQGAEARKNSVTGNNGFQTKLSGRLRWVEPQSKLLDPERDDHFIALSATKRLYDFGQSSASIAAAEALVSTQQWRLLEQQKQHRINIMEAFFNVILADLAYARDNELMAIAFVRFDRAQDRNKLGQIPDVDMLEAENTYHVARSIRYASDVKRRSARSLLANILNFPGELPANLVRPELVVLSKPLPDIDKITKQVLVDNPGLQALRQQVESAQQRVVSARARNKPTIDLELQAAEYSRNFRSSDKYRGGFIFEMPLTSSGAIDADIAEQRSLLVESRAALRKAEMDVRQEILELWQQLYVVKAQRDEAAVFSEFRDAALDKDRGLYELDVAADLGDSLALYSAANYQRAKADFDYALTWARLDAILGKQVGLNTESKKPVKSE